LCSYAIVAKVSKMSTVVSLKNVRKNYSLGGQMLQVLKGIDLDIERGDFMGIMGPSGSGKSTLMNLVGLLDRPDSGTLSINGKQIGGLDDNGLSQLRGRSIGFVFQSFNLVHRMTAQENVEMPMIFQGVPLRQRTEMASKYLKEVGLLDRARHKPAELSGGERQRVAIARALVSDPAILLADEPTGNLDTKTSAEIMDMFAELNARGRTIVMVTHNPELTPYCNRVIRLRDGQIVREGGVC
jgi:putative ABC transport system ATP-binding protein